VERIWLTRRLRNCSFLLSDRLEDYNAAETAAEANPRGDRELEELRQALVEMPGAVRMLIEAIDRAGVAAGEPQYDAGYAAG
jgi:hypothetical protein